MPLFPMHIPRNPLRILALTPLALALTVLLLPRAPAQGKAPETQGGPTERIVLGMGCFWGAEKRMEAVPGVLEVRTGYANGDSMVAGTYNAVLDHERALRRGRASGRNHAEVVKLTFDPTRVSLEQVLIRFWESHDPTQGDRQGNDHGSNYRSAIYTYDDQQRQIALRTRDHYQQALTAQGHGTITTELAPLVRYFDAEDYHQDYLAKNPLGYCGLGGTGVAYPATAAGASIARTSDDTPAAEGLSHDRQIIVFEADGCPYCRQFKEQVLDHWQSEVPVISTMSSQPPSGWTLEKPLFATPTTVLFEQGREVSRFTGYQGDAQRFWKWLGFRLLTPEQQRIAFDGGTEPPFTGSHLDEKRRGTFVDPVTGAPLFRSDTKFDSGTGWPSFFNPVEGAITEHPDESHGMRRVEVRSASSGIHLGHVFEDGPPPTHKRYCINGEVLKFHPDE